MLINYFKFKIRIQFTELANDINFPQLFDSTKFFSSVFRISSPLIRLWTHYDVNYHFISFVLLFIQF